MGNPFKISRQHYEEMQMLVEAGEYSLPDLQQRFLRLTGRVSNLSDDQMTVALAAETDGEDDQQFVQGVQQIEEHGYEIVDGEPEAEAAE